MGEVIGRLGSPEQTLAQAGPIHVAMHAHTEIAERDRDAAVRAAAASGVERDRLVRITRMRPQHLSVVLAAGHEDDLRAAVEVVEQSRAELRDRVLAAVADGVTKYRIAQITGLSRTTIDAWLRDAE